jgi:hypothetical protein
MRRSIVALAFAMIFAAPRAIATDYFVATDGNDANRGTKAAPFATLQSAQAAASPGDTVYIRGGTYVMEARHIARRERIWAYVILLDKSGERDKPITYTAYENEKPVFDFSRIKPPDLRVTAFRVPASWIHIKGLEVVGVQVTITGHTQSICFDNEGSNNVYEQLTMHDGQAIGLWSVDGSDNLFLNCDAYRNYDYTSEGGKGGNVDGFGCHPSRGSRNNVFRGCRAWFNSDDGFDCIGSQESVTFENCWAFYNGFGPNFQRRADGNGFKGGGYGSRTVDQLPKPIPRHVIRFCLAAQNKANGFYSNHHIGGSDWFNNTAFHNAVDFNMLCREPNNRTDVPGYGHKLRNNLALTSPSAVKNLDKDKSDAANNSFTLPLQIGEQDFVSVDESQLTLPRQPNGDLPAITFMHPKPHSPLFEAGVDVGLKFTGKRPALGAFDE